MTKVYREFWNTKGEELCRSSALSNYKPGEIHGAINIAWKLEKSKLIKDQVRKINDEINQKCPDRSNCRIPCHFKDIKTLIFRELTND